MNAMQRMAVEIANKTLKIAELEPENERLQKELDELKAKQTKSSKD